MRKTPSRNPSGIAGCCKGRSNAIHEYEDEPDDLRTKERALLLCDMRKKRSLTVRKGAPLSDRLSRESCRRCSHMPKPPHRTLPRSSPLAREPCHVSFTMRVWRLRNIGRDKSSSCKALSCRARSGCLRNRGPVRI